MADQTPEEIAAAALAKAQEDAAFAPVKARLMDVLNEWADTRAASQPPPKTQAGGNRPVSFLEGLIGLAKPPDPPTGKTA